MISKEEVKELSKRFHIDEVTVLREYLEVLFLSSIYSFKESSNLFFKGGTSIRLLLGSFRFSEDLDFTSLLENNKLIHLLEKSVYKMKETVRDINLKDINKKKGSFITYLNYKDPQLKYPLNIHMEFSIREKPLTKRETILETLYPIVPYPIIVHLDWKEILAEKVRALMKRSKGRDLFDVWYLLTKGIKIDIEMVNKKMEYYDEKVSFEDILNKVKNFDEKNLYRDLSKFLPATHRKITKDLKNLVLREMS